MGDAPLTDYDPSNYTIPCPCLAASEFPEWAKQGCNPPCRAEGCDWPCKTCGLAKFNLPDPHPLNKRCGAWLAVEAMDLEDLFDA